MIKRKGGMSVLPNVGSNVYIQSYKHDGTLHRTWAKGLVLRAQEDVVIVVTHKTWVTEADGRSWYTREPAICFFYPDKWFNIISMIRKTGIYYYCNLASPSIFDGESIKNIDYDLDVKVYPNRAIDVLDEDEFDMHREQMNYSSDIIEIVRESLDQLLTMIENEEVPFDQVVIEGLFQEYLRDFKKKP
jgi:uncharacterized protein